MKKISKLVLSFLLTALCVCSIVPFTACGGNGNIVESYVFTPTRDGYGDLTIKLKNINNLPQNIYMLFVPSYCLEKYGSLNDYLSDPYVIKSETYNMSLVAWSNHKKGTNPGVHPDENNEIHTGGSIYKYIFLYDFNDVPLNSEAIEGSNLTLLDEMQMMDLHNYVGFVEIVEAE